MATCPSCTPLQPRASFLWRPRLLPGVPSAWLWTSSLPSLQAFFIANSSPLPGSILQTPRSSPQPPSTLTGPHFRLGCAGCGTHHQVGLHSVLPATDQLLHSAPSPQSSFSDPADLPAGEGGFPRCRTFFFSFSSSPLPRSTGPVPACSLLSFFCPAPPVGILFVLSGVQGPLLAFCRYSVRIVPFVGRDEAYHVLLLCRLDSSLL